MYKSVKGYSNLATSILLALLLVAMSWSSIGDNVHYDGYKLIFSDEFNQADGSQPDSMKWTICKRYNSMWNRWISNSKDVVYIKDGKLVCRAIPNNSEPNDTAKMLTGAIESIGKFSFKYGRVDVRLKTNLQRGNFPAVWMKPNTIDPNKYGEIDIFESFGEQGLALQTIHNQLSVSQSSYKEKVKFNKYLSLDNWHIYSVLWTPQKLTFLIDNIIIGHFEKSQKKELQNKGQWTFDRPFYLILNQSVGDGRNLFLNANINMIYETQIDWIRVYQKK